MTKISSETGVSDSRLAQQAGWNERDEASDEDFKPLTTEQAAVWRKSQVQISVWQVLGSQALVGALVGGVIAALGH